MKFARILVATDFGHASMEALSTALQLAESLRAQVELLNVYDAEEGARENALAALQQLAALYSPSTTFARYTALQGNPASVIVSFALEVHADLLVVGLNGGLGCKSELLGGVAESVLRNARCPVVVARQSELSLLAAAEASRQRP